MPARHGPKRLSFAFWVLEARESTGASGNGLRDPQKKASEGLQRAFPNQFLTSGSQAREATPRSLFVVEGKKEDDRGGRETGARSG